MNILITGGSGLIGQSLTNALRGRNHNVRILSRQESSKPDVFQWNPAENHIDERAFENLDSIIHLAGASISKPWSAKYRKELYESRISTAALLKKYCERLNVRLTSFISASGVNYYGTFTSDRILTEDDGVIKKDFLAKLCEDWEAAAYEFADISDRVVCVRTAMVLAKNAGAFQLLKKSVDYYAGAATGSGQQWMNWIHLEDLVNLYVFAVENKVVSGNFNAVADDTVRAKDFTKSLAGAAKKPFLPFNVPSWTLKLALGEMSSIILEGSRVSNKKIKSLGFDFKFSTVDKAFKDLV
ncbi:TIGR01777 family oxidoreductase [Kaistella pullorum]|uniref:TIGR01777 family protein n=1 Tax=Kaistella pullorum TaxID=2763074 RepID=A0ABR8WMU3_9FLAO|nr:TIGR01777 family oxidoreductase [Kaistella pullorum]MBD8018389.1 TIGR01777 family protein [Kaistella pullorum]